VSSPFLSLGYGLTGSFDQASLNGANLFEMLGQAQLTLDGGAKTITGGPALSYSLPLGVLCLLFALGVSFYKSRTPAAERKIAAALLGTGVFGALVVVIVCAVYWANFKPPTFGDQQIGYFRVQYGAVFFLLGSISIVVGSYMMLALAKANSAAPPEPPDAPAEITGLGLNRR
jgi:hypothetical protein